jgi:hypothetical protein
MDMNARHLQSLQLLPYVLFLLVVAFFADNAFVLFDFPVDDAWIHRVYARSMAMGHGMAYNGSAQETGSTSPLWVILTAPLHWLEFLGTPAIVLAVKILGCLLAIASIFLVWKIAYSLMASAFIALLAASMFALEPRLVFSAFSGMEPILLLALLLSGILAILENKPVLLALALGLASVTRPEAVIFMPFFALALCLYHRQWAHLANPLLYALAIVPGVLWLVFCKLASGFWLPNTFYAKAESLAFGIPKIWQAWQTLTMSGWGSSTVLYPGLLAFLIMGLSAKHHQAKLALLLIPVSCFIFSLAIVSSREMHLVGYYWTRWTDPSALTLTALMAIGFGMLLQGLSLPLPATSALTTKTLQKTLTIAAILALLMAIPAIKNSLLERKYHLTMDARAIHALNVSSGQWIKKHTPVDAIIAVNDAGGARYFGERHTLDLLGLNNYQILHQEITFSRIVEQSDYWVVFPEWFKQSGASGSFSEIKKFEMSFNEYTVCPCPTQTQHIILQSIKR